MSKFTAKEIKAATKEGGKKGQDLAGLKDLGGISYFHVALTDCKGSIELVQLAMDGANKPVDEGGDDRKGGAGELGKFFLSAGPDQLVGIGHVPPCLKDGPVKLEEWVAELTKYNGGVIQEGAKEDQVIFIVKKEPEKFPLKERDSAIGIGFQYLRSKGVVPEEDDSSDIDWEEALEDEGIDF